MSMLKTHTSELDRLRQLQEKAETGGGAKLIEKRRAKGFSTARERILELFDPDSFTEINQLAESQSRDFGMEQKKVPGDGVIIGHGTVHGRLVFAYSQDATVLGGSVGTIHGKKICRIMDEALKVKAPLVALNDSGGGRLNEGFLASQFVAGMFFRNTAASGVIPQISAILGPCAGVSAYSPALTDFIAMVEKQSQMVITGPGVIKAVTGEDVTLEELGGARVHGEITGTAHFITEDEHQCIQLVRHLLSYLPANHEEDPPAYACLDDPNRLDDALEQIVPADPRKGYDMRQVIFRIVDNNDFLEVFARYATNLITGFGRMAGQPSASWPTSRAFWPAAWM
jgi:methylmalonyl-CoA decarboxylase subunit alpha